MKRLVILIMLFIVVSLSACEEEEIAPIITTQGRQVAESFDDNFRIILYSEKDIYGDTEEINIWGTLEYIGPEDSIDIHSGDPYIGFNVESEGVYFIQSLVFTILMTTTLEKGVVHEFPLRKSGGFGEDDEDADFWRDFYTEERMLFPIGEYQLTFSSGFDIDTDSYYHLGVQYQFEVTESYVLEPLLTVQSPIESDSQDENLLGVMTESVSVSEIEWQKIYETNEYSILSRDVPDNIIFIMIGYIIEYGDYTCTIGARTRYQYIIYSNEEYYDIFEYHQKYNNLSHDLLNQIGIEYSTCSEDSD